MANRVEQKKKTGNKTSQLRSNNVRVAEEVKLGKFAECEPLHLPKKEVRRGWQIFGGVVLLVGAVLGALTLMASFSSLFGESVMLFQAGFASSDDTAQKITAFALAVWTVVCLIAGIMMLAKKRVPVGMWCVLIAMMTVMVLCISFRTFRWYEERLCYENYPGIYPGDPTRGSQCPSVENDLILLTLRNLAIWTVGLVMVYVVCRFGCGCKKHTKTMKR